MFFCPGAFAGAAFGEEDLFAGFAADADEDLFGSLELDGARKGAGGFFRFGDHQTVLGSV